MCRHEPSDRTTISSPIAGSGSVSKPTTRMNETVCFARCSLTTVYWKPVGRHFLALSTLGPSRLSYLRCKYTAPPISLPTPYRRDRLGNRRLGVSSRRVKSVFPAT